MTKNHQQSLRIGHNLDLRRITIHQIGGQIEFRIIKILFVKFMNSGYRTEDWRKDGCVGYDE